MVKVAVLGYGTVGSGVVEVIETNKAVLEKRIGDSLDIKYVLDLRDFPGDPIQEKVVHDYDVIVQDPEISIVVEVMGGIEPAYTFVKQALLAGRSACTSNKALVAKHGAELLRIAKEQNCNFFFEASVGGGIPIIRPMHTSLSADVLEEITGILNGTTNYILSKMANEGLGFEEVLKDAQEKGFAERNPEADVEGYDACRKIAILSSLALGRQVDFEDIYTEGITKITAEDFAYAKKLKRAIKLLATSRMTDGKVYAMVAPFLIPEEHPLYSVNNVFNAIFVRGNMLGDAMFYGSGAGKLPTASAVVGDVVEAARRAGCNEPVEWAEDKLELSDISSARRQFLVRVSSAEASEEKVKEVFGAVEFVDGDIAGELGFLTPEMSEADYEKKAAALHGILNRIRIG